MEKHSQKRVVLTLLSKPTLLRLRRLDQAGTVHGKVSFFSQGGTGCRRRVAVFGRTSMIINTASISALAWNVCQNSSGGKRQQRLIGSLMQGSVSDLFTPIAAFWFVWRRGVSIAAHGLLCSGPQSHPWLFNLSWSVWSFSGGVFSQVGGL